MDSCLDCNAELIILFSSTPLSLTHTLSLPVFLSRAKAPTWQKSAVFSSAWFPSVQWR